MAIKVYIAERPIKLMHLTLLDEKSVKKKKITEVSLFLKGCSKGYGGLSPQQSNNLIGENYSKQ